MEQPWIRMRHSPLVELFRSTATAATGATEETSRANAAAARLRSQWRPSVLDMVAVGVFLALTVFVLVRAPGRPAHGPQRAAARTVRGVSPPARFQRPRGSAAAALRSRAQTPVLVLNGNGITGAAAATANSLRARGYPITAAADAPQQNYPQSLVMYKHGFAREAKRLARELNRPTVLPLDPLAVPGATTAALVLIVGGGHA